MMTSHCVPFGTYWADRPLGRYGESDQTNVGRRVGKLCPGFWWVRCAFVGAGSN